MGFQNFKLTQKRSNNIFSSEAEKVLKFVLLLIIVITALVCLAKLRKSRKPAVLPMLIETKAEITPLKASGLEVIPLATVRSTLELIPIPTD